MLPPLPLPFILTPPVTAQQDVPKPRPEIVPVTPTQASAQESGVDLNRQHPQDALELLYEEQRRHHQPHSHREAPEEEQEAAPVESELQAEASEVLEEYAEVQDEDKPRQGLWIDVNV